MQWKLSRGKWRPRLLDFVSSLDEELVKSASQKAFESLPDLRKAVSQLTVLKGVGPATASAVLAAYAPDVAPFMSDEAMEAALGTSKDYTLKQYLLFTDKLLSKSKLSVNFYYMEIFWLRSPQMVPGEWLSWLFFNLLWGWRWWGPMLKLVDQIVFNLG
ncbi:hypothetical protein GH714_004189 [Hevea brasiliensis]|uniref:Uncharacterized protein n=1 Tax=Hevea brasiliensis TaxID=3981 RepID=A0A6A6NFM9_HEVBR|nr:hypothetical protein GH714_004189 [Hevea brasiliensis]